AGTSPDIIAHLDKLAARPGCQVIYSVGWDLGKREKAAITRVREETRQVAIDPRAEVRERRADDACADRRCGHRQCWIEEAHVTELPGLLAAARPGTSWPAGPHRCASSPAASGRTRAPS